MIAAVEERILLFFGVDENSGIDGVDIDMDMIT